VEVLPEIWFGSLERPAESPLLQWFPIVTAPQVGIDMMFAATVGHGHDHAVADYIEDRRGCRQARYRAGDRSGLAQRILVHAANGHFPIA